MQADSVSCNFGVHHQVSVVIPTIASAEREAMLLRAIQSVRNQREIACSIIVVINGERFSSRLKSYLESRIDLQVVYCSLGSLPNALLIGRQHVRTEFFCILDDDDELIPDTLTQRVHKASLLDVDVLVSNGKRFDGEFVTPFFPSDFNVNGDPGELLVKSNWLASCGGLFRESRVPVDIFVGLPKFYEWTAVAHRLAMRRKHIAFDQAPAFQINFTPYSLSRSPEYFKANLQFLKTIWQQEPSIKIKRMWSDKICDAYHAESCSNLRSLDLLNAWKSHVKSVSRVRGFFKYILYSRHLLRVTIRRKLR
jgi:glycosyltransferase involved in cell wall biosynthesis